MAKRSVFFCAFVLAMLVPMGSAFALPILELVPDQSSAWVGDSVRVDVIIHDAENLCGYDISLDYDPTVLQLSAVEQESFLASFGPTFWAGAMDASVPGHVQSVLEFMLNCENGAVGDGILFSLEFDVIAAGTGIIDIAPVSLLSDAEACAISFEPGSTRITGLDDNDPPVVPEPATLLLVAIGVGGGALISRRRH